MKKVLIITYYWPPAGGPGVQRILRFVKYLPQMGWQPIILTVEKGNYPAIDYSLVNQIPKECKVYKTPVVEPHSLYRKFTGKGKDEKLPTFILTPKSGDSIKERLAKSIRCNIFIPDSRIGWIPYAVKTGLKILKTENIDLIFSSSPPNTVHLIAKRLAKKCSKKWIADFRDPWTEAFWARDIKKMALSEYIDLRLEKSVLRKIDASTTVSEGVAKLLSSKVENKYVIIQNGFEPPELKKMRSDHFLILYSGHLRKYQNPRPLFQAVDTLSETIKIKTKIVFIGKVFEDFEDIFQQYKHLSIERKGYMPYKELMQFARRAGVLFNPIVRIDYANSIVGAKLYDYLALRKPILTLGDHNSISETIMCETGSGELIEYEDIDGIADFLQRQFKIWEKDGYILLDNEDRLIPYTTRYNVERLVKLFEETLQTNS
jgi:hypothetical protein